MPIVTPQDRPSPVTNEENYRAPKKTITASTGMDLNQSLSGAPQENRQTTPAEETSAAPREVTLSPQLTALARKEAKFRQQEQAFKAEQVKLEVDRAEIAKMKELKTKLEAKDYSILEELNVSYEEWTNYLINKGESVKPEVQAIKKLEDEIKSIKTANEQNVNKQYEATVSQYRRDIKNLVESNPEFDSIKSQKAEEHVLQHILDTFNEDGEILTIEQAAKEVEDAILEDAEAYLKLSKIQAKLKPVIEEKKLPPPRTGLRTLTNQVTQANPSAPRNQFQHLSMKERIAQAVARSTKS